MTRMPFIYEEDLPGEFDHIEPVPVAQALAQSRKTFSEAGMLQLKTHIASAQLKAMHESRTTLEKLMKENHHRIALSVYAS